MRTENVLAAFLMGIPAIASAVNLAPRLFRRYSKNRHPEYWYPMKTCTLCGLRDNKRNMLKVGSSWACDNENCSAALLNGTSMQQQARERLRTPFDERAA